MQTILARKCGTAATDYSVSHKYSSNNHHPIAIMLTAINNIFSKACSGQQDKGKYRILKTIKIFTRPTLTVILKQYVCVCVRACVPLLLSKHVSNFAINKHTFTYVQKKQ